MLCLYWSQPFVYQGDKVGRLLSTHHSQQTGMAQFCCQVCCDRPLEHEVCQTSPYLEMTLIWCSMSIMFFKGDTVAGLGRALIYQVVSSVEGLILEVPRGPINMLCIFSTSILFLRSVVPFCWGVWICVKCQLMPWWSQYSKKALEVNSPPRSILRALILCPISVSTSALNVQNLPNVSSLVFRK